MFTLGATLVLPTLMGIDLQIQPAESALSVDTSSSVANTGSLIGNHDAETNPEGTITIPGLWGGSGNQAIPIEFASGITCAGSSNPAGSFSLEPFEDQGIAIIHDLAMDMLNGSTIPVTLSMTILYESFHTQNPTSVFPGGIPITLPIAQVDLETCMLDQVESVTALMEKINDTSFSITAEVPVMVTMEATFEGQPIPFPPMPAVMLLIGEMQYTETGTRLEMTIEIDEEEVIDIPGDDPLPAFPLSLPTIVPPGSFANVLVSLVPQSTTLVLVVEGAIVGTGEPETLPCDVTGDGVIDTNDILAVLAQWGVCPDCPADTNDDGVVDVNDVLNVLKCWPA